MRTIKNVLCESVRCSNNGVAYPQLYVKEINILIDLIERYEQAKRVIVTLIAITFLLILAISSDFLVDDISLISNDIFRIEEAKAHDLEVYKNNIGE